MNLVFRKTFKLIDKNPRSKALFFKDLNIDDIFILEYKMDSVPSHIGMRSGYYQQDVLLISGELKISFTINQFLLRLKNVVVEEIL